MDDLISRQAVYDALNNIKIPRNASWYPYYQQALTAVSKLPSAQPDRGYIEQIRWERDTAIQQLKELGHGMGEKPRTQPCENCPEFDCYGCKWESREENR